ncbi:hypothetical protein M758_UG127700 [Ceratodon purpureus]|nr:hypothetical protein M758_UG127700 [Ceratodon purpureus]
MTFPWMASHQLHSLLIPYAMMMLSLQGSIPQWRLHLAHTMILYCQSPLNVFSKQPRVILKQPKSATAVKKKLLVTLVKTEKESSKGAEGRMKRKSIRPSRYLNLPPPSENKPHSKKCEPQKPKRSVSILHPHFPNKTIGIGKSEPSWRSKQNKVWIPNFGEVVWELGMQQVALDHVYPQYRDIEVLHQNHQGEGIMKMSRSMDGPFDEDTTIVWKTSFLKLVEP